jgi:hypothetical protein
MAKDISHVFVRNWIDELHGDDMCALRTFTATMVILESIMFPKYLRNIWNAIKLNLLSILDFGNAILA